MSANYRIAIVGAASIRGKELNEALGESPFESKPLQPLTYRLPAGPLRFGHRFDHRRDRTRRQNASQQLDKLRAQQDRCPNHEVRKEVLLMLRSPRFILLMIAAIAIAILIAEGPTGPG